MVPGTEPKDTNSCAGPSAHAAISERQKRTFCALERRLPAPPLVSQNRRSASNGSSLNVDLLTLSHCRRVSSVLTCNFAASTFVLADMAVDVRTREARCGRRRRLTRRAAPVTNQSFTRAPRVHTGRRCWQGCPRAARRPYPARPPLWIVGVNNWRSNRISVYGASHCMPGRQ